jgi:hypothetical protein
MVDTFKNTELNHLERFEYFKSQEKERETLEHIICTIREHESVTSEHFQS